MAMSSLERDAHIRERLAKLPELTLEERDRQRESFARGNLRVDAPWFVHRGSRDG